MIYDSCFHNDIAVAQRVYVVSINTSSLGNVLMYQMAGSGILTNNWVNDSTSPLSCAS